MGWLRRSALGAALALFACVATAQGGDGFPTGLDLVKRCNALNYASTEDANDDADAELDAEMVEVSVPLALKYLG